MCKALLWEYSIDELLSKKRYEEAARVFLDHAKNVRQCINVLVQGSMFSEARRIVSSTFSALICHGADNTGANFQISLHGETPLLEEIVQPATLDTCTQITDDLGEMRTQLRKQLERIRELRVKKTEEPGMFIRLKGN